jgi:hypothetical protein
MHFAFSVDIDQSEHFKDIIFKDIIFYVYGRDECKIMTANSTQEKSYSTGNSRTSYGRTLFAFVIWKMTRLTSSSMFDTRTFQFLPAYCPHERFNWDDDDFSHARPQSGSVRCCCNSSRGIMHVDYEGFHCCCGSIRKRVG